MKYRACIIIVSKFERETGGKESKTKEVREPQMPIARPEPQDARVVAHVDMDCFYVQVEQRKQPDLRGLPTAVVQYNDWKGGALVAVSYEARKFGVNRSMRGDEAKKVCPSIHLVQVPMARGKGDLSSYRNAGSEVVCILSTEGRCERASIDEVYLDLTDAAESMLLETPPESSEGIDVEVLKSHVLGVTGDEDDRVTSVGEWLCRSDADYRDKLLACGAIIVARLRMKVLEETKFTCSAGIAHNKMLAKLASAMHKPAQQTVVPSSSVKDLLATLPVKKMKQLGGKLGSSLQSDLGVNTVGDLLNFSEEKLQDLYGTNTGSWLWNIARGISGEEVEDRLLPKSHGCGKLFPGPKALKTITSVEHWLNQFSGELSERIQSDFDQNKRVAHTLTLHACAYKANDTESQQKFPSKSCPLRYGIAKIHEDAKKLFDSALRDFLSPHNSAWGVTSLSISASKILDTPSGTCSILKFFQGKDFSSTSSNGQDNLSSPSGSKSYMMENEDEQQRRVDIDCEATGKTIAMFHQDLKTSGKLYNNSKDKGTCSILRFFQGTNTYSTSQACSGFTQNRIPSSPEHRVGATLGETSIKGHVHPQDQNAQRSDTWALNVDDIDPSVIDELPPEIQREVRAWLRPSKRLNSAKKGSDIAKKRSDIAYYFSPAKSS